jgi:hypothetical protein
VKNVLTNHLLQKQQARTLSHAVTRFLITLGHNWTSQEKAMNLRELGLVIVLVLIAYAAFRLWKAFNSPDGERYLKRRMQGPFVPLTPQERASDEMRKRQGSQRDS